MRALGEVLRWTLLIGGIVWGLLQLNGALFAAWVSGGPPNPNPEAWLFVAGNRLCWAAASFLAAGGLFLLLRRGHRPRRYAFVALVLAGLLAVFPRVREFVVSDACIDSGGRWSDLRCIAHDPAAA